MLCLCALIKWIKNMCLQKVDKLLEAHNFLMFFSMLRLDYRQPYQSGFRLFHQANLPELPCKATGAGDGLAVLIRAENSRRIC